MVVEDALKRLHEFSAALLGEFAKQRGLRRVHSLGNLLQSPSPATGEGDEVLSPVVGVLLAIDVAVGGELVERGNNVAAVDVASPAELGLADRTELLYRGENRVLIPRRTDTSQGRSDQSMGEGRGLRNQPARGLAQPGRLQPASTLEHLRHGINLPQPVGATND